MTAIQDARTVAAVRTRGLNRVRLVTIILVLVLAALFIAALALGSVFVSPGNVLGALFGDAPRRAAYIVNEVRLPRALTGVLAGLAFGLSGGMFQSMVRNPLASPDVIGITMGASAAAVVCILGFGLTGVAVSGGAFAGALATAILIYVLAWRRGVSGYRLVLIGIGVAAVLSSVVSYMITRADVKDAQQALIWLTGSLTARTWIDVTPIAVILAVVAPLVLVLSKSLKALQFGDDVAKGLGVSVEQRRLSLMLCGVALAAAATAAAGPVAFVAFVSGPIARRLVHGHSSALVPSALVGAVVLLGSDLIAQHLLGGTVLPVGVVTGVLGAPYLLWLMATRSGRAG
ncbi:FecCD family ABC transporter permease [Actinosynnema sp. ALI-1.44]|uniref:FecCD family ABC transporter permease n=1 Tax=Actinosynnema sp. ALI-1.44 TaxID=1933779 RepID=UPI0009FD9297|nr:iron chelate uptake ABC transporter family permease subunit [Actinosynnema sp. ALI-1.44]